MILEALTTVLDDNKKQQAGIILCITRKSKWNKNDEYSMCNRIKKNYLNGDTVDISFSSCCRDKKETWCTNQCEFLAPDESFFSIKKY